MSICNASFPTSREFIFLFHLFVCKSIFIRFMYILFIMKIFHGEFWQIIKSKLLLLYNTFSFDSEINQLLNGWNFSSFTLFVSCWKQLDWNQLIRSIIINRTKSNQRWMKLRTTVQLSSAIQKKPPLKREDSFLKRFSTRQIPETQVWFLCV